MLTNLSVQNIVLIKNISVFFGHRLSVFTGETGAGKSILLDALSLALGGKFSSSIIRTGESSANVSAVFNVSENHNAAALLNENSIPFDAENPEIILRRSITSDGKSKSFINDVPVSLSVLKAVGETLVEIHGQFDNQGLMNPSNHIKILDTFSGLDGDVETCRIAFLKWKDTAQKRMDLEISIEKARADEEYIRYNLDELKALNPRKNEETELSDKRKNFLQNKKIILQFQDAISALNKNGNSITESIRDCLSSLKKIPDSDIVNSIMNDFEIASEKIDTATYNLEKLMAENMSFENIDDIEERLFKIRELSRKHRCLPDDLNAVMEKFSASLAAIVNSDDELKKIKSEEEISKNDYFKLANILHEKRLKFGRDLSEKVCSQLPDLKLEKANFTVTVVANDDEKNATPSGIDTVQFIVSTNVGMQSGLISKIASGGELARFMLAIKVALAAANPVSTFVFDELDTGISGATASAVGERLFRLSENIQVMLVTHSAQVASFGTHHFKITKDSYFDEIGAEKIETKINHLDDEGRIMEIARIISDDKISDTAISQAKHLLAKNI